jgi:hypothetical protein
MSKRRRKNADPPITQVWRAPEDHVPQRQIPMYAPVKKTKKLKGSSGPRSVSRVYGRGG